MDFKTKEKFGRPTEFSTFGFPNRKK